MSPPSSTKSEHGQQHDRIFFLLYVKLQLGCSRPSRECDQLPATLSWPLPPACPLQLHDA